MKPGDFYVGSRQLTGFLLPGVLTIIGTTLLLSSRPLAELLQSTSKFSAADWFALLLAGYVVGTMTQPLLWWAAELFKKIEAWFADYPHGPLYAAALKRLTYQYKFPREILPRREGLDATVDKTARRDIVQNCKRVLIARGSRLALHVVELDAELNLLATLPLPTLVVGLGLFRHADEVPRSLGVDLTAAQSRILIVVGIAIVTGFGLYAFGRIQDISDRQVLKAFLTQLALDDALPTIVAETENGGRNGAGGHTADTPDSEEAAAE